MRPLLLPASLWTLGRAGLTSRTGAVARGVARALSRAIEDASGQLPLFAELSLISRAATVELATTISRHRQIRSMAESSDGPGVDPG